MSTVTLRNIADSQSTIFDKSRSILLLLFVTVALIGGISIYYAIEKPTDVPIDTTTDIDWNAPPCSPNDLSDNWREITDSRMLQNSNRRIFQYKDTKIKIAFEKGQPNLSGHRKYDHWHRYNPNFKNDRDLYLDQLGNSVGKNSDPSHIKTNCK